MVVSGSSVKVIKTSFPAGIAGGRVSKIKNDALVAPIVTLPTWSLINARIKTLSPWANP